MTRRNIVVDIRYQIISDYSRIYPVEFLIKKIDKPSLFKIMIDAINNLTG